jgi:hypothetical protein
VLRLGRWHALGLDPVKHTGWLFLRLETVHVVQFFDTDDTRHDGVAAFLREGHLSGAGLLLIARPRNSIAILERLDKAGIATREDMASGRLSVLDASETLKRISRAGSPDAGCFDEVVGALATRATRAGRMYAYGEMVDILAQQGDFADATLLEELWNRLLLRAPISLMCGYAAAHFVSPGSQGALRHICALHTDVRIEAQDPLAAWLLAQAQ